MRFRLKNKYLVIVGFVALALTSLYPLCAAADEHPQEVLDLIAAHNALAMKIRPLQDRLEAAAPTNDATGFKAEGAPVRAKASTAGEENTADAEKRMPATLTHRNRAAGVGDDYGRIKVRLSALAANAKAERERVMRPRFGVGLRSSGNASSAGSTTFGDGQRGARPAPSAAVPARATAASAAAVDASQIADARRKLAELRREFAGLEREVAALEGRASERQKN
jgi:hypothetical protein